MAIVGDTSVASAESFEVQWLQIDESEPGGLKPEGIRNVSTAAEQVPSVPSSGFGVMLGGGQDHGTEVVGGGVAGTRISPDSRAFMTNKVADLLKSVNATHVVELGCGHAVLGCWVASILQSQQVETSSTSGPRVTLTDVPDFLDLAQIAKNANPHLDLAVMPFRFGDANMLRDLLEQHSTDAEDEERICLVGAGVTFWESVYEPLAVTVKEFLSKHKRGVVVLGYFRRNWSEEKRMWTKLLKGLDVQIVHETLLEGELDACLWAPLCTRDQDAEWNGRVYMIQNKS